MIIPYGHEHTTVRRLPWVTFTIMGLCVVMFVVTSMVANNRSEEKVAEGMARIFEYLAEHPYLELDSRFIDFLRDLNVPEKEIDQLLAALQAMGQFGIDPPDSERALAAEREELERLIDELLAALAETKDHPFYRWGVVPADMKIYTLVTYQFVHGGFWHLIGNLFFLFLAGPFIEDVWGRPLFASFYLVAGTISAVMFAVHYPQLDGPLIGASGAVAGVMGAFLIRYWNAKIRFFYWFFVFFSGTFMAPAWLMLSLWFLRELLFAQAWDVVAPGSGGGGVAHWAHVWGFAFGLAVAYGIKHYRVEERYIHESIESKITLVDNTAVERAMEAHGRGDSGKALELLRAELKQRPNNVDAAIAMWNLASVRGEAAVAAPYLVRVIRQSAREDDPAIVLNHWHELLAAVPDVEVDAPLAARVAEILMENERRDDVDATLEAARRSLRAETAPGVLARLAKIASENHSPLATTFIDAALAHAEMREELRAEMEQLASTHATAPAEPEEAALELSPMGQEGVSEVATVEHMLQVMEAVPQHLEQGELVIEVQGSARRLSLGQVQAIGVGGIKGQDARPFLVVDLLLDPPWGERPQLRALRLLSNAFDPRRLVGGADAMQAFRHFIDQLLTVTEAVPLPDPEAARGNPFRTFTSIEEYQHEVLGVG